MCSYLFDPHWHSWERANGSMYYKSIQEPVNSKKQERNIQLNESTNLCACNAEESTELPRLLLANCILNRKNRLHILYSFWI